MTPEPETFEEAVELFEDFLRQNNYSPAIVWVELDDLIFTGSPKPTLDCLSQPRI